LKKILGALQSEEAAYQKKNGLTHLDEELESTIVHLSQLKKFFQSKMTFDVSRSEYQKRFSELIAICGAALAALWAGFLQIYGPLNGNRLASSGTLLLLFAVLSYIAKDRIKKWSKKSLTQKTWKWLSDRQPVSGIQRVFIYDPGNHPG
jgi:hypothetical protein